MAKDFLEFIPQEFPELQEMPLRDAQIILLSAAGIPKTTIAEGMGIGRQTVYDILNKHQVSAMIQGGVNLQMMLTRCQIGQVMVEAASMLMSKRSQLKGMKADALLNVIQKCSAVLAQIKVERGEQKEMVNDLANPMNMLKEMISEKHELPPETIEA
jgi:hypothetical protein